MGDDEFILNLNNIISTGSLMTPEDLLNELKMEGVDRYLSICIKQAWYFKFIEFVEKLPKILMVQKLEELLDYFLSTDFSVFPVDIIFFILNKLPDQEIKVENLRKVLDVCFSRKFFENAISIAEDLGFKLEISFSISSN